MNNKLIIQLICPDQKGIIAKLTSILYNSKANILSIEQHVDNKKFYIRVLADISSANSKIDSLNLKIKKLNDTLGGEINLFNPSKKINAAILGSNEAEPIYQLLIKNNSNELNCNFPLIISNHNKLKYISKQFSTEYIKINDDEQLFSYLI